MRITVVDYGRGNLFSLARALVHLDVHHLVTSSPSDVESADCLILPGVGAFKDAMLGLHDRSLVEPLKAAVARKTPLLGICLGMQILASRGEEFGSCEGLDLIPGTVKKLPEATRGADAVRIPNVGWRHIQAVRPDPFLGRLVDGSMFYFVHSYAPEVVDPAHVIATISMNGADIAAIIRREQIVGCQFHPEKSGLAGLALIKRFLDFATRYHEAA